MQKRENWYNAFADDDTVMSLYQKYVDYSFEMSMERVMTSGQGQPFIDLANLQNEKLAKGNFFGWCAPGLQTVGKFISNGTFQGDFPKELAKMNFEGSKKGYKIDDVRQLGRILLNERRKGKIISLQNLYDFIKNKNINPVIKTSVKQSLIDLDQYKFEDQPPIDSEIRKHWEDFGETYADQEIRSL